MHAKECPSDRFHGRRRNKQVKGKQNQNHRQGEQQGKKKKGKHEYCWTAVNVFGHQSIEAKKETNGSKGSDSRPNPTGQTDPGGVGKKHRKHGQVLKPGMASKHTSIQHALTELARTVQSAKRKAARLCTQYYIIRAAGYAAKRNGKTRSRV